MASGCAIDSSSAWVKLIFPGTLFIVRECSDNRLVGIVPLNPDKTGYSAFEVDDFLLGHFEDEAGTRGAS